MNMWGEFYSSKTNTPYSHLTCVTGFATGRMLEPTLLHIVVMWSHYEKKWFTKSPQ